MIVDGIREDYNTAQSHVEILQEALDKQKAEANDMAEKLVQYNILEHDAEANKQLYDGLLQKLKEASITAGLRSSNIRIVDPALVPSSPSRPQKARNILLALLVGLVGGIGLALFREYLDNTVKSPDDIESLTGLPSLAVVPSLPGSNGHHSRFARLGRDVSPQAPGGPRVELLSYVQPKSQISEAFRALRTSLLLSQAEHPPQVILVTSALPREGKTTAAVNLAVTLAQLGDRTLLMDSDMRKPGIRRALNLTTAKEGGLSSYLAGVCTLEEATIPHPAISNLSVLTTGPVPPSPADLLSSHRMREGIAELRRRYKFIVIDSPPIMAATDAVILSALTDGVLLVVRSGETPKEAFTRSTGPADGGEVPHAGGRAERGGFQRAGLLLLISLLSVRVRLRLWRRCGQDASRCRPEPDEHEGLIHLGGILRHLITGGAGFIGSHLAEALLERGDEVFILDDLSTGSVENIRHLKANTRVSLLLRFDHEQTSAGGTGGRVGHRVSPGGGGGRAADRRKPREDARNQRLRDAAGAGRGVEEEEDGIHGVDFGSLRQEQSSAVPGRRGPGAGADHEGALELRGLESAR